MSEVLKQAKDLQAQLTAFRRDIHRYAESGWTEFRTASKIASQLHTLGYEVLIGEQCQMAEERMGLPTAADLEKHYQRALEQGAVQEYAAAMRGGFTAVVGILRCGEGPVVGIRFDIDAVDVQETEKYYPAREGFNSQNPSVMHSCGHDAHATIGLGVASLLMANREKLHGTIKLVFQPAEEGVRGAKSIVASGILDDVQYMLAGHVSSMTPTGVIFTGQEGMLATNKFDAIFSGAPAHAGGAPQGGKNALLAAACAVLNLQAIPRHSAGATRINVGRFTAGTGRNVIPEKAHLALETRGETSELNSYVYNYALRILESAAAMHDCTVQIVHMGGAEGAKSDPALMIKVEEAAKALGCYSEIHTQAGKSGGSEDYTYMMQRVQQNKGLATFVSIGAKPNYEDAVFGGHHTAEFDLDESVLATSAALFSTVVLDLVK